MGITLNNTADSGSTNVTLLQVIDYIQTGTTTFPTKRIPGKTSPSIDTDTYVVEPTFYRFQALCSDLEKAALQVLRSEMNRQCKLTDNELTNVNVRPVKVEVSANVGHVQGNPGQYPWIATIELEAEDH